MTSRTWPKQFTGDHGAAAGVNLATPSEDSMSLPRTLISAAAAALIIAVLPAAAHAQAGRRTACNDGSTTTTAGANACDGHGGINKGRTAVINRAPGKHTEPARVAQAGTPAPSKATPRYEEHRGWRWSRHHDERKREEKHRRVRCRDGRYESVEGNGKNVCKHHGGIAH